MLRTIDNVPFSATDYPITVAEVSQATVMMDKMLSATQRDELVDRLAYQPNVGEVLGKCAGIRSRIFEFETSCEKKEVTVIFFFHDLNMPLYILAVYIGEKVFSPKPWEENEMNSIAAELVQACIKGAQKAAVNDA